MTFFVKLLSNFLIKDINKLVGAVSQEVEWVFISIF